MRRKRGTQLGRASNASAVAPHAASRFRGRREYIPVGSNQKHPVFDGPEIDFRRESLRVPSMGFEEETEEWEAAAHSFAAGRTGCLPRRSRYEQGKAP